MKYRVLDNGQNADASAYPEHAAWGWYTSLFSTIEAANQYANDWIGAWVTHNFKVNTIYKYTRFGDTIQIKEVEEVKEVE